MSPTCPPEMVTTLNVLNKTLKYIIEQMNTVRSTNVNIKDLNQCDVSC